MNILYISYIRSSPILYYIILYHILKTIATLTMAN